MLSGRDRRGILMAIGNKVRPRESGGYSVESESEEGTSYIVELGPEDGRGQGYEADNRLELVDSCTCPDFQFNEIHRCKHIQAVNTYLAIIGIPEAVPHEPGFQGYPPPWGPPDDLAKPSGALELVLEVKSWSTRLDEVGESFRTGQDIPSRDSEDLWCELGFYRMMAGMAFVAQFMCRPDYSPVQALHIEFFEDRREWVKDELRRRGIQPDLEYSEKSLAEARRAPPPSEKGVYRGVEV